MRPTLFVLFLSLGWTLACTGSAEGEPADDAPAEEDGAEEAPTDEAEEDEEAEADDAEACCAIEKEDGNTRHVRGPKSKCDEKGGTVVEDDKCAESAGGARGRGEGRRVRKGEGRGGAGDGGGRRRGGQ